MEQFLAEVDARIDSKHLLKHPFYHAWSKGELSLECLQDYAKEYYHHVQAFPGYLSRLHARMQHPKDRKIILQNLIEEEAGSPNHPELWKQFALALGVTQQELEAHTPNREMAHLIQTFQENCSSASIAGAIASLYAYESQIPEICISKIDGLKKYYRIEKSGYAYFSVHIAADTEHAAQERELLTSYLHHDHLSDVRLRVERVLDALWNFLSGLCTKYNIRCEAA
jgi:pyrroloquinoline-quinone synthase